MKNYEGDPYNAVLMIFSGPKHVRRRQICMRFGKHLKRRRRHTSRDCLEGWRYRIKSPKRKKSR